MSPTATSIKTVVTMSDIRQVTELTNPPSSDLPLSLPTSKKSNTFHHFPKLPTELRDMIWEFSLSGRTITIEDHDDDQLRRSSHNFRFFNGKPTVEKIPIAGVCHEAQSIIRRNYRSCFADSLWGRPVLINFKIDKLYFVDRTALLVFYHGREKKDTKEMEGNLRFLGLGEDDLPEAILESLGAFKVLELLSLEKKSATGLAWKKTEKGLKSHWRKGGCYVEGREPKIEWNEKKIAA